MDSATSLIILIVLVALVLFLLMRTRRDGYHGPCEDERILSKGGMNCSGPDGQGYIEAILATSHNKEVCKRRCQDECLLSTAAHCGAACESNY